MVSESQQRAALAGSGLPAIACGAWSTTRLAEELRALRPDAVLVAARGPLARVLARLVAESVAAAR